MAASARSFRAQMSVSTNSRSLGFRACTHLQGGRACASAYKVGEHLRRGAVLEVSITQFRQLKKLTKPYSRNSQRGPPFPHDAAFDSRTGRSPGPKKIAAPVVHDVENGFWIAHVYTKRVPACAVCGRARGRPWLATRTTPHTASVGWRYTEL